MNGRKTSVASRRVVPATPSFRARAFTDAGGKRRFGISVSLNGDRYCGSVPMSRDNRADSGGVAALLESMAGFLRRG